MTHEEEPSDAFRGLITAMNAHVDPPTVVSVLGHSPGWHTPRGHPPKRVIGDGARGSIPRGRAPAANGACKSLVRPRGAWQVRERQAPLFPRSKTLRSSLAHPVAKTPTSWRRSSWSVPGRTSLRGHAFKGSLLPAAQSGKIGAPA